jgi:hypothetical protein
VFREYPKRVDGLGRYQLIGEVGRPSRLVNLWGGVFDQRAKA